MSRDSFKKDFDDGELNDPAAPWVRFDEREDVLASLELLALAAPRTATQPLLWKWVIVGAQSGLQGAMVCALADTTGTSILKKKSTAKMLAWLEAHRPNEPPPREWLEDFEPLLEQCEQQLGLALDPGQREDILRLHNYFRNNFIHFTPKGWSIEKAGLPRIIKAALAALDQLMKTDRLAVHLSHSQSRRYRTLTKQILASF